jgi:hypothetical protein
MFLGIPDPDQLVRGMDPDLALDPDPSLFTQHKGVELTEIMLENKILTQYFSKKLIFYD